MRRYFKKIRFRLRLAIDVLRYNKVIVLNADRIVSFGMVKIGFVDLTMKDVEKLLWSAHRAAKDRNIKSGVVLQARMLVGRRRVA